MFTPFVLPVALLSIVLGVHWWTIRRQRDARLAPARAPIARPAGRAPF